jgi:hypothetical protein
MESSFEISQINDESTASIQESGQTSFFSEIWRTALKKCHVANRFARVLHRRPIIYTFTATLLGVTFLPLVVFLLFVCGSFGFGIFIFVVIEGGLVLMAAIALLVSLFVPVVVSLIVTTISYATYKTTQTLRGVLWQYLGGPIWIFQSFIHFFTMSTCPNHDDHTSTRFLRNNDNTDVSPKIQDSTNFENTSNRFQIQVVPVEERQTSYEFFGDEFQNWRFEESEEDIVDDETEDLGIVEGALLYMANFLRNLMSLLMCIFLLQLIFSHKKEN